VIIVIFRATIKLSYCSSTGKYLNRYNASIQLNHHKFLGRKNMKTAGGIVALIAGIFGILSAGVTLLVGGIGSAVSANDASTVMGLGWGGVIFSFITIILAAVALGIRNRMPGILLVLNSIAGAILGGTLVAIFMVLSLIGGILVIIGGRKKRTIPIAAEIK
jgi:hypothetical protein